MTTAWVTPPHALLLARSAPYLAIESHRADIRAHFVTAGIVADDLEIGSARSLLDFFLSFRAVVRLPEWCANDWDSLYDAFDEIRQDNDFPKALLIGGLSEVLGASSHLGLSLLVRLLELVEALATHGDQLSLIFFAETWSVP